MRSVGITRLTATVVATGKAVTEGGLHYRPDSDSVSRADACLPACSVAVTARPVARRPNLESDSGERAPVREPLPLLFSGFCTHEKTNLFFCWRGRVCVCVCHAFGDAPRLAPVVLSCTVQGGSCHLRSTCSGYACLCYQPASRF